MTAPTRKPRSPYKSRWAASGDGFLHNWARLYTKQTASELAIEPAIAALGKRYRFQHPFFGVHSIADFVLPDDKIVIEVDGKSHNTPEAKAKDRKRSLAIENLGWVVVRCTNAEAQKDPVSTVARLLEQASDRRRAIALLQEAI